ncbi:MAG: rod-binding protein [Nitrospirae bacterium]|nr:rod-binding protein [Nitrospirota bacterium]
MDLGQLALQDIQALGVGTGQQAEQTAQRLSNSGGLKGADRADIEKAAKEFEGYFVSYLMKVMRETVPHGLLENKYGEELYYFYDQEIGRLAAERGGLGFADMILQHYDQENSSGTEENPLKSRLDSVDEENEPVKSQGERNKSRRQG